MLSGCWNINWLIKLLNLFKEELCYYNVILVIFYDDVF